MTDPAMFLWAIIGVLLIWMLVVGVRRMRQQQAIENAAEARQQEQLDQLDQERVSKGTHMRVGGKVVPRCYACQDQATCHPYMWDRNEGVMDLIRRKFRAPARVTIGLDKKAPFVSCAAHHPVLFELFHLENAQGETDHAKLEMAWETRRARFQREGVYERAKEIIEQHRVKVKAGGKKPRSSNVVPISKAAP